MVRIKRASFAGLGLILGIVGGWFGASTDGPRTFDGALTSDRAVASDQADFTPEEQTVMRVFERAAPSVVNIDTTALQATLFSMRFDEVRQGSGSGFVYDKKGHVVTNFHVIEGAIARRGKVFVTLKGGDRMEARIVGVEPDKDLALLKIDADPKQLVPVAMGRSDALRVGQTVLAIGNPFGLDQTLTTGVVSALGREIQSRTDRKIQDVIQTDAAINPGNSGGPLLDSRGRVIGVNTQIYSPSGASAGIGFAIPASAVERVVPQLIQYGRVNRPVLGVRLVSDAIAQRNGIEGVIIESVEPGGPADRAGLRGLVQTRSGYPAVGDVIVAIDDKPVRDASAMLDELDRRQPGDDIKVTVQRGKAGTKETFVLRTKKN
jgi:S1-C subfamily serine protease